MLNQKEYAKKEKTSQLKQKGDVEFFITIFIISLLTLLGIFTSHYNNDKFYSKNKGTIPTETITDIVNTSFVFIPEFNSISRFVIPINSQTNISTLKFF